MPEIHELLNDLDLSQFTATPATAPPQMGTMEAIPPSDAVVTIQELDMSAFTSPEVVENDEQGEEESESVVQKVINVINDFGGGLREGIVRLGEGAARLTSQGLSTGAADLLPGVGTARAFGGIKSAAEIKRTAMRRREKVGPSKSIAETTGRLVGEIAPTLPIGGLAGVAPKVGSIISKVLSATPKGAATGGLFGGLQLEGNQLKNTAVGTTLGAVAGGATGAITAGKRGISFLSGRRAGEKVTRNLKPKDVQKSQQAVKTLDLPKKTLTPGQASGEPILSAREGRLLVGEPAQVKAAAFTKQQAYKIGTKISVLIDDIMPNRVAAQKTAKKLFQESENSVITPKAFKDLMKHPTFKRELDLILKDPELLIKGTSPRSIKVLQFVKQSLDQRIKTQSGKVLGIPGEIGEKSRITKTIRKKLINILDNTEPRYKMARKLQSRLDLQEDLLVELSKKSDIGITRHLPQRFLKAFLETPEKTTNLIKRMKGIPGAVKRVKALKIILSAIDRSPFNKLASANIELFTTRLATDMAFFISKTSRRVILAKHDKVTMDLLTSGKWHDELLRISKLKGLDLVESFYALLNTAASRAITSEAAKE